MRKEFKKNYFQPIQYKFNEFTPEAIKFIESEIAQGWSMHYALRVVKNGRRDLPNACLKNEKLKELYLSYLEKVGKLNYGLKKLGLSK